MAKGEDPGGRGRRGFLELMFGTSLVGVITAVAYPVVRYLIPPPESGESGSSVVVGKVEEFPPDSGKIFRFGRTPGLLLRLPDGTFRAFNATCTHLACIVQYRKDLGLIWCACHNGRYDLTGKNIAGPPPRPLAQLRVDVKDDEVHVSRLA